MKLQDTCLFYIVVYHNIVKIISWNVNSVRVRLHLLKELIENEIPDVILLQETKCVNDQFPKEFFENYGYNVFCSGQKTYNGVAIISKFSVEDICENEISEEKRYLEGLINGNIWVASVYIPCGAKSEESYQDKLKFFDKLSKLCQERLKKKEKIILGGDFNVALTDQDVRYVERWQNSVLCRKDVREKMYNLINIDSENCLNVASSNVCDNGKNAYTWWDYRRPDDGLRIDYFLYQGVSVEQFQTLKQYRTKLRPSDHVPIAITIKNS